MDSPHHCQAWSLVVVGGRTFSYNKNSILRLSGRSKIVTKHKLYMHQCDECGTSHYMELYPWEMTRGEFAEHYTDTTMLDEIEKLGWPEGRHYVSHSQTYAHYTGHQAVVKLALNRGKAVPDRALVEYPDLAGQRFVRSDRPGSTEG